MRIVQQCSIDKMLVRRIAVSFWVSLFLFNS
nr:MAG TPA: hypothetical protein [Caudoviricetes sp.]